MTALMRLLVEATGPHGDGSAGGGSEPLWLAAATERDRRQMALRTASLAAGAMVLVGSRAFEARDRDDADSRQRRRSAVALTEAFCAVPGAAAGLVAAAAMEESLSQPNSPVISMFWMLSRTRRHVTPPVVAEELMVRVAMQLEPCAAEAAALACRALRDELAGLGNGSFLPLGLLQLLSYSAAGAAALLQRPLAEGLGLLVRFLTPPQPGDNRSRGARSGSGAERSESAGAQRGAPAGAGGRTTFEFALDDNILIAISRVFEHAAHMRREQEHDGAEAAPQNARPSALSRAADPARVRAAVAALTGPLLEVAAGRSGAARLRGEPRLPMSLLALHALEQSVWSIGAGVPWELMAEARRGGSRPAPDEGEGEGEEEEEPLVIHSHPGSAAALAGVLQAALGAADSSRVGRMIVATSATLLNTVAMACGGPARTQWCRDALAARLPALLLRAAVQLSTHQDDPVGAARAVCAACLVAYTEYDGISVDRQGTRCNQPPPTRAESVTEIRARALEALLACAGGGCPEAANVAVGCALRACSLSGGCAADLAARCGAATALVGALLRCASDARAAAPGGSREGGRMAGGAGVAALLLSMVAAAACEDDAEANDAAEWQCQHVEATLAGERNVNIEQAHAAAEAALLRLCTARSQGGALADDMETALGFLRRREAPPPLSLPGPLLRADGRRCLACGKGRGDGVTLRRCTGCRAEGAFYCSVEW
ncbi:hypothetical protein MNEG_2484 [Monoraphidium neglectum]|uniref:Uncharacterized protein n=1 Tax=Monoraphidium neglectum TaxID=145388 RepID=A0A0D2MSF5_9CHLO|nr:hypothetical protein MNEG_2484 [Monoraphidium neglectum]KIZ05475.1 hypothetical protein MNEG_2484 [Monoraphidium neglectum]|eukprot:XP_013904494.1 hypothetical protein MNEG_2484 [Monoraphidium neglectum]